MPSGKRVPIGEQQAMAKAYAAGATYAEAAALFGRTHKAAETACRKLGVASRWWKATDEHRHRVVEMYGAKHSPNDIAAALGISDPLVRKILRQEEVKLRSTREGRRLKSCSLDEGFFEVIDTEEKAYWLGFIAADGCVGRRGYVLTIALSSRDRDHLTRFLAALKGNHPVRDYRNGQTTDERPVMMSKVCIGSARLVADLAKHGIVPAKSFVARAWQGPAALMRHYWRGVFDGDGCIHRHKRQWSASLVGSRDMMLAFGEHLVGVLGAPSKVYPHKSIWVVSHHRLRHAQAIASHLYGGATVFLPRKKARADEMAGASLLVRDWSWLTGNLLLEMLEKRGTWVKVAAALGLPGPALHGIKKRLGIPPSQGKGQGHRQPK